MHHLGLSQLENEFKFRSLLLFVGGFELSKKLALRHVDFFFGGGVTQIGRQRTDFPGDQQVVGLVPGKRNAVRSRGIKRG